MKELKHPKRVMIYVSNDMYKKLRLQAAEESTTVSELVRELVESYFATVTK